MEDTPICASVERDLQLSLAELTASMGTAPAPEAPTAPGAAAPPIAPETA